MLNQSHLNAELKLLHEHVKGIAPFSLVYFVYLFSLNGTRDVKKTYFQFPFRDILEIFEMREKKMRVSIHSHVQADIFIEKITIFNSTRL